MHLIFGSHIRAKILTTLSQKANLSIKEIAYEINENFRSTFKVLKTLEEGNYVFQKNNRFSLSSKFFDLIITLQNNITNTYRKEIFLEKKQNIYNLIKYLDDENLEEKISVLIEHSLLNKLDQWYGNFYDPHNCEFKAIEKAITSEFNGMEDLNILEIGCGIGKITQQLSQYVSSITALDSHSTYISFCKNKLNKESNITFENTTFENFTSEEQYDVIIFSWSKIHNINQHELLFEKIKKLSKNNTLVILLDAYHKSEYISLLEHIKTCNTNDIVRKKFNMSQEIIEEFGNLNNEIITTHYQFDSISKIIEQIKIELCIEENYSWSHKEEEILKEILISKKNPLFIEEKFWIASFRINKEDSENH